MGAVDELIRFLDHSLDEVAYQVSEQRLLRSLHLLDSVQNQVAHLHDELSELATGEYCDNSSQQREYVNGAAPLHNWYVGVEQREVASLQSAMEDCFYEIDRFGEWLRKQYAVLYEHVPVRKWENPRDPPELHFSLSGSGDMVVPFADRLYRRSFLMEYAAERDVFTLDWTTACEHRHTPRGTQEALGDLSGALNVILVEPAYTDDVETLMQIGAEKTVRTFGDLAGSDYAVQPGARDRYPVLF